MNDVLNNLLPVGAMTQTGMAFNIRVIPDLFTGEQLNIGVAVIAADGRRLVRVIHEPGRLSYLYGEDNAKTIVFLAGLAASAFEQGQPSPSPNLIFEEPTPFFNLDAETALSEFFRDQVTVAIPLREEKQKPTHIKTEALRAQVYQLLRQKSPNLEQDHLIPSQPITQVETARGLRKVRVPLTPKNGAGGIESADYSPQTIKTHLLDALLDLEFAAKAKGLKKLGLFIARPGSASPAALLAIDNAIDYVVWRAPENCRISMENSAERLTEEIIDWAQAA